LGSSARCARHRVQHRLEVETALHSALLPFTEVQHGRGARARLEGERFCCAAVHCCAERSNFSSRQK
jgi:hypothetical protein